MTTKITVNDEWVAGEPSQENQRYRVYHSETGFREDNYRAEKKEDTERQWRDNELLRTDELVKLPDYPVDLLPYRASLRAYPQQVSFPNGTRPAI